MYLLISAMFDLEEYPERRVCRGLGTYNAAKISPAYYALLCLKHDLCFTAGCSRFGIYKYGDGTYSFVSAMLYDEAIKCFT